MRWKRGKTPVVVVVVSVRMAVKLSGPLVVAFAKVLVVLVTIAVMFPIISRRTIPGGLRRVVVVVPPPRGLIVRTASVDVGWVNRVLLVVVREGVALLKLEPKGVKLRLVVTLVVVVGRPLDLEEMTEFEEGIIEELLGRMLELGVGVAELENGRGEEVDALVVMGPGHSVTVLVTVSSGRLAIVTVAGGAPPIVIVAVLMMVTTLGGQAAQRAVAISQMAVERDCDVEVGQVLNVTVVVRGPRVVPSRLEAGSPNCRAMSMAPVRSELTPCPSPAFISRSAMTIPSPRTGELANKMQGTTSKAQQFLGNMMKAS
jgi:hypothetical protein